MTKVTDSEINEDEIIRSFRDNPASLSSLKMKPPEEFEPPTKITTTDRRCIDELEREFVQRFVAQTEYSGPETRRFLMVEINPDFIHKIKRILSYEERRTGSIKSYVNNVLEEHFEKYADIIKKRL